MTRLKDSDDLDDVRGGYLGSAFRSAAVVSLRRAFVAAAGVNEPAAQQALTQFEQAARTLRRTERDFRERARTTGSLLSHLRSPEQLAAAREFSLAKETLLGINPNIGSNLVRLMTEEPLHPTSAAPRPASRPSL
jgi:hypothetical protein